MATTDFSTGAHTPKQAGGSAAGHPGGSTHSHNKEKQQKVVVPAGGSVAGHPGGSTHSHRKEKQKSDHWYDSCGTSTSRSRVESRQAHTCQKAEGGMNMYRLADVVKLNRMDCKKKIRGGYEVLTRFPHSIAADFLRSTKTPNDYEVPAVE